MEIVIPNYMTPNMCRSLNKWDHSGRFAKENKFEIY